jgi:hypothetical protein
MVARIIFQVDPDFARKRRQFRSAGVERAWLEASAGMQRAQVRVERAVRFRQFPPLTLAYAREFPQQAGRIRELRGEYHRQSHVGWAGRERYREQLLREAWAVACA